MGFIHGDIKLANICLHKEDEDSEEIIKLIDFGLSLVAQTELDGKAYMNNSVGTFGYMAPELKGVSIITLLKKPNHLL